MEIKTALLFYYTHLMEGILASLNVSTHHGFSTCVKTENNTDMFSYLGFDH